MGKIGRKQQPKESRKTALVALFTFAMIFGAVVVFVIRPTAGTPSQAENDPADSVDGQVLYDSFCAACHGKNGEAGVVPDAPSLNAGGEVWRLSDDEIVQLIRNGNEKMPAMGSDFTDEQVEAVLSHIKGWWTPEQRSERY